MLSFHKKIWGIIGTLFFFIGLWLLLLPDFFLKDVGSMLIICFEGFCKGWRSKVLWGWFVLAMLVCYNCTGMQGLFGGPDDIHGRVVAYGLLSKFSKEICGIILSIGTENCFPG